MMWEERNKHKTRKLHPRNLKRTTIKAENEERKSETTNTHQNLQNKDNKKKTSSRIWNINLKTSKQQTEDPTKQLTTRIQQEEMNFTTVTKEKEHHSNQQYTNPKTGSKHHKERLE